MTIEEQLYKTIKNRSNSFIKNGNEWKKEISSAKNYIATPDLNYWAFGKSVGINNEYHADGGTSKKWLYSIGFTDVLQLSDSEYKSNIITNFLNWGNKIKCFDIIGKFNKDQLTRKRFELLIHSKFIPKELLKQTNFIDTNQSFFNEGFKKEITIEINSRKSKLVELAKIKHGTKCEVCSFDFGLTYGVHGEGFIEMHHLYPIALGKRKSTINDLMPVCSNCHRMLHKGDILLSIEDLKEIIKNAKGEINKT